MAIMLFICKIQNILRALMTELVEGVCGVFLFGLFAIGTKQKCDAPHTIQQVD